MESTLCLHPPFLSATAWSSGALSMVALLQLCTCLLGLLWIPLQGSGCQLQCIRDLNCSFPFLSCGGGTCKFLMLSGINTFSCPGLKGVTLVPAVAGRHSTDPDPVSRGGAFTVTRAGQKRRFQDERRFTCASSLKAF